MAACGSTGSSGARCIRSLQYASVCFISARLKRPESTPLSAQPPTPSVKGREGAGRGDGGSQRLRALTSCPQGVFRKEACILAPAKGFRRIWEVVGRSDKVNGPLAIAGGYPNGKR